MNVKRNYILISIKVVFVLKLLKKKMTNVFQIHKCQFYSTMFLNRQFLHYSTIQFDTI